VKHWNYFIDLPRWQTSYTLGRLRPGKPYFVKILAKNVVGFTEYSDWNEATPENSCAGIDVPDPPKNVNVVAGTCISLTIEFRLPFSCGSPITGCYVQRRIIETFSKGAWGDEKAYDVNNPAEVKVIEFVEPVEEEFDAAMPDDKSAASKDYNPFDRSKKKRKKLEVEKSNKYGVVSGPEYVLKVSVYGCIAQPSV
jgi:hypothetical protein